MLDAAGGTERRATDGWWTWLLRAGCAASVLPLWRGSHLPIGDLPQHVAAMATLRHWWDPAWRAQEHFVLALDRTQYLLYYVVGAALTAVVGSAERANLILLSCIAVAIPYAVRSLLRALGADERAALLSCAFFWNQSLLVGFFNYLAAIPLVLWGLSLIVRHFERPTKGRFVLLSVVSVAIFFLHVSAFLFFVAGAVLATVVLPVRGEDAWSVARARAATSRLGWGLPALACAAWWVGRSDFAHAAGSRWVKPTRGLLETLGHRIGRLPDALFDVWRSPVNVMHVLALGVALALLLARRETWRGTWSPSRRLAGALFACAVAMYFLMPNDVAHATALAERYAIVAALLVLTLVPVVRDRRAEIGTWIAAAGVFWAGANATGEIVAFGKDVGAFDRVLAHAAPGKRLLSLVFEPDSVTARFPAFVHFGSYYQARYGGVASFSFAELPQFPIRHRPDVAPPKKSSGWEWSPCSFRNEAQGSWFDYVLVRGERDPFAGSPPGPAWRRVVADGPWALYERVQGLEVEAGKRGHNGPCKPPPETELVPAGDLFVQRWEVTRREYAAWLGAPGVELFPERPITGVSREEAAEYCADMGARLPTLDEQRALASRARGAPPRDAGAELTVVGAAIRDRTPERIHDLVGNAPEWTSDGPEGHDLGFRCVADQRSSTLGEGVGAARVELSTLHAEVSPFSK